MNAVATHGQGLSHATRARAICCDVLDAWFDPSPKAISAFVCDGLHMRSSPDTEGRPLIEAISEVKGLNPKTVTLGAGSSEIIHRVLPTLLGEGKALLLDPTYSEYSYVAQRSGRPVKRLPIRSEQGFCIDLSALKQASRDASTVILVNPNNPTGKRLTREEILELRLSMRKDAVLWVDEAYVDYCPSGTSVEKDVATTPGLIVLKSLSKAYALSGIRAAYLVAGQETSAMTRAGTPPWIIGTSAQEAAIAAIQDKDYYADRWSESRKMVVDFAQLVAGLGLQVTAGWINAVLVQCPDDLAATCWAKTLAKNGLIVRTPLGMGDVLGERYLRIGLVERSLWPQIIAILKATL